ncbi:uncharacterized protein [Palaemon carinicauda]|uniref:uncharacterized protein n=1 Tax=Palaemon carinicauda TaxID=392227 RepID=UPI0035B5C839
MKISIMGRDYEWLFQVADVKMPLLDTDFLAHPGLLVDVRCKRLVDQDLYQSHHLSSGPRLPWVCSVTSHEYSCLLQEFPVVFKPELRQLEGVAANHGIFPHISTTGPLTHCRFRRLPLQKLQDAKHAFQEMERMGICKKASHPWASPLHMVKKPNGSWKQL